MSAPKPHLCCWPFNQSGASEYLSCEAARRIGGSHGDEHHARAYRATPVRSGPRIPLAAAHGAFSRAAPRG